MAGVERTTTIPAGAEDVWDAVVSGDWLGEDVELEPWPGGDGLVIDRGEIRHVVVERVEPGRQLVYRWWPMGEDGVGEASRVTIDVEPEDQQTRVVVTEMPAIATPLPPSAPLALARV